MVTLFSSPLFSYKFMWYDGYKTLDHGCLFNFVVGNRGCGKSYWAKKWAIRDFLKNGKQFIYLRRFDTEHAGIKKYFDDIEANEEFPGVEFSVSKQNILKINGMDAGYPLALTKAKIQKSVSFPDVNKIIFDEFLLDKGYQHYLPDECVAFLELYETVARMREVTVMFLSNSISTVNPYFIYFDIQLPYNSNIYKRGDILLQVVRDDEFVEAKKQGGLNNDWDLTSHLIKKYGFNFAYDDIVSVFQKQYWNDGNGSINNENLLIDITLLEKLKEKYNLAVFTGRPKDEACYTLKKFDILKYFDKIVTMDDVPPDRQKPHTDGLELIKNALLTEELIYFGDTVDDIKCALDYGAYGVGVLTDDKDNNMRQILLSAGAKKVIDSINNLQEILENSNETSNNITQD